MYNEEEESKEGEASVTPMVVDTTPLLEDIVGQSKAFTDDFQLYKGNDGVFNSMGVTPPSTFLLEGAAGTGKTLAIHALNNSNNINIGLKQGTEEEVSASDYGLLVFEYSIGRHGTAYINRGSRVVQNFFDKIGIAAKFGIPVLCFIDEADALLGSRRGDLQTHAEDRKVLETIMKNLQVAHDTPNLYVALASNTADQCDDAALRAGRIDKRYHFRLPTEEERTLAYNKFIGNANERAGYKVVRGFAPEKLAEMSNHFSYADIKQSVDEAIIGRATELVKDKTPGIIRAGYVTQKRLEASVKEHNKSFNAGKSKKKSKLGF